MDHLPIDLGRDAQPIRLFKSNFLEFFTHISPVTVVALWLPISALFLLSAVANDRGPAFPLHIPLGFVLGLFLWTFAEYTLHRFCSTTSPGPRGRSASSFSFTAFTMRNLRSRPGSSCPSR